MRILLLAAVLVLQTACANSYIYERERSRLYAPWDPDPRKGESLLNQRRPQCAGTC